MKEIKVVWTRDYTLAWAQWWSVLMNPRLIEIFGCGVPNQLSYFNGRLLETYRLVEESDAFIEAVINANSSALSERVVQHFVVVVTELRQLLAKIRVEKTYGDAAIFKRIKEMSAEMYPWYTVSYLLPQEQWAQKLVVRLPLEAPIILGRLIEARKRSEGAIEELVEYWREEAKVLLTTRKLPTGYAPFVTFDEIERMLIDPSFIPRSEELTVRSRGYIYIMNSVYTGVSLNEFFSKQSFHFDSRNPDLQVKQFAGSVACSGAASLRGRVQIILTNDEIVNFNSGNVLVTVMTNPLFVPIMKQAVAVVTDEGGITCHAAIAAREFGIPCVTGTKIATKVLKEGDMVEVDAAKGIVRKI